MGGRRYRKALRVTEPSLRDVSEARARCPCVSGVGSFLLYSVHEGIRGIPLDPNDKSDALVPVSGTSLAVGIDFHAGEPWWQEGVGHGLPSVVKCPGGPGRGCLTAAALPCYAVPSRGSPGSRPPPSSPPCDSDPCSWSSASVSIPVLAPLPPENDTIYWVDMGLSTISRAKRDQTWREDVVTNGIGRVEGIAVDWIAGERWEG